MKICLLCEAKLDKDFIWSSLLYTKRAERLCLGCRNKFQRISGSLCKKCGREQTAEELCHDCLQWEADPETKGLLTQNRSVFLYTEEMKEALARYKFRGDTELVYAFESSFLYAFKSSYPNKSYTLAPIPLSEDRIKERGFNQTELLASLLDLPTIHPLIRKKNEKQSKKSRRERLRQEDVFTTEHHSVLGKDLILIDDLYTTGSTLHQAARCLKKIGGANSISSFTLIRS
ncbi:double zinc ribbon domain-containing protein [Bacillus gobiensis]|uniref:double zinc ribbon domain-containing protein n=1 Tax=Bacillus gobiensis TaxID=1441095 RepID=UPI003D1C2D8C